MICLDVIFYLQVRAVLDASGGAIIKALPVVGECSHLLYGLRQQ